MGIGERSGLGNMAESDETESDGVLLETSLAANMLICREHVRWNPRTLMPIFAGPLNAHFRMFNDEHMLPSS